MISYLKYAVLIVAICILCFIYGAWSIDHKFLTRQLEFENSRNLGDDFDYLKRYSDSIDNWDIMYMEATDSVIYYGNKLIMGGSDLTNREEILDRYVSNTQKILDLYKN